MSKLTPNSIKQINKALKNLKKVNKELQQINKMAMEVSNTEVEFELILSPISNKELPIEEQLDYQITKHHLHLFKLEVPSSTALIEETQEEFQNTYSQKIIDTTVLQVLAVLLAQKMNYKKHLEAGLKSYGVIIDKN